MPQRCVSDLMKSANAQVSSFSPAPRRRRLEASLLLVAACAGLGVMAQAPKARADLVIAKGEKWEVSTNGRVNAFLSYITGDGYPAKNEGQTHNLAAGAGLESFQTDEDNKLSTLRLRSGQGG